MAPFAGVVFLLLMFLLFGSAFVHTPGVRIDLPELTSPLPGPETPTVSVAVDRNGLIYFEHQVMTLIQAETQLLAGLTAAVKASPGQPLSLVLQADRRGRFDTALRVLNIAHAAGIKEAFFATRWGTMPSPTNAVVSP